MNKVTRATAALLGHRSVRAIVLVVLAVVASFAVASAVRYGLIERDELGPFCDAQRSAPWWCGLRMLIIRAFLHDAFGLSSVALAAVALWRRSSLAAYLALVIGTWGMVLYTFTWSGVGVIGGALAIARLQGQRQQDRQPEQQSG